MQLVPARQPAIAVSLRHAEAHVLAGEIHLQIGVVRVRELRLVLGNVRSSSRSSVSRNHQVNRNNSVSRSRNVNRNIDVNRDIDVDVDVHHRYGYGGCCYHSSAGAFVAGAVVGAAVTAAVVGTRVVTLPPACSVVIVNGFAYHQCGTVWYQPQISGSSTTYIVVNSPR